MFRRLRQSAGQASKIAWLEDQENNQDEWRRTKRKKNEAANFTGTWRLNASESDSLWFICHKLGCPMYVRPFVDSSWLSLVTIVKHDPERHQWHEEMIKARFMSFDNDLVTDGTPEIWPSTFDSLAKVHLKTWCEKEEDAIITVLEHHKYNAVQRMTRRMNANRNVVMITNVFSFMNDEGIIETTVHRSKFDRDEPVEVE